MQMKGHRMINIRSVIAACLVFLLLPISTVSADSSVWKVSKGDSHIYLGGTLHILSKSDYPLPVEFDEAYSNSDLVVFETDIAALSNPATMQLMISKMLYTDGSTIHDHLAAKTINTLQAHLKERGMSLAQYKILKPSMMAVTLMLIELKSIGIDAAGVDTFYSEKATADDKEQLMLETTEEQIEFVVNMGADDPDKMLEYTIRDLVDLKTTMDIMLTAWREGDPNALKDELIDEMARDYPKIHQNLIVDRNKNWLPKLASYFDTGEIEFVMVGAAHLVGEVGLLKLLEADGYKVEKL